MGGARRSAAQRGGHRRQQGEKAAHQRGNQNDQLVHSETSCGPEWTVRNGSCANPCRFNHRDRAKSRTAAPKAEKSGRDTGSLAALNSGCHCTDRVKPGASLT